MTATTTKPKTKKHYPAATMRPAEVPEDVNQAFALVEPLMWDQVHKFHRRYGGDKDELAGLAGEAFTKGHAQFVSGVDKSGNPHKMAYATSIRLWVWYTMFDKMRARIAKNDATEALGERDFAVVMPASFDLDDLELSADGRRVCRLLLDPPNSVEMPAERKGGTPRNYRSVVREWLEDRGWHNDRVNAAFNEIRNALKE